MRLGSAANPSGPLATARGLGSSVESDSEPGGAAGPTDYSVRSARSPPACPRGWEYGATRGRHHFRAGAERSTHLVARLALPLQRGRVGKPARGERPDHYSGRRAVGLEPPVRRRVQGASPEPCSTVRRASRWRWPGADRLPAWVARRRRPGAPPPAASEPEPSRRPGTPRGQPAVPVPPSWAVSRAFSPWEQWG